MLRGSPSIRTLQAAASALVHLLSFPFEATADERSSATSDPTRDRLRKLLNQDFATGEWNDLRPRLNDYGIEIAGEYTAAVFGVVSGGKDQGAVYNGLLDLGFDMDLEKLTGLAGTRVRVRGIYPHGASGSEKLTGDIGVFTNLDLYDSLRLYELWLDQELFSSRVSLRAGLMVADEEFTLTDTAALFWNSGFTARVGLTANMPFPTQPNSALGVRLRAEPVDGLVLLFGAFDGNPAPGDLPDPTNGAALSNEHNHFNTHLALRSDEGALLLAEIGYFINQTSQETADKPTAAADEKNSEPVRRLAGSYRLGMVYHTDSFIDIHDQTLADLGSSLAPATIRDGGSNYALHVSAEQELWREQGTEDEGLSIFFRGCWAPQNRNVIEYELEAGLVYRGLFPGREEDLFGIGYAHYSISDAVIAAVHNSNVADRTNRTLPDYEGVIEVTYAIQITPCWSIQPDLQYLIHPGGSSEIDDAWVIGLASTIIF